MEYNIEITRDRDHTQRTICLVFPNGERRHIFSITDNTQELRLLDKEQLGAIADIVSYAYLVSVFKTIYRHIVDKNIKQGSYNFTCEDPGIHGKNSPTEIEIFGDLVPAIPVLPKESLYSDCT